jgi:hypothetical protein
MNYLLWQVFHLKICFPMLPNRYHLGWGITRKKKKKKKPYTFSLFPKEKTLRADQGRPGQDMTGQA